MNVSALFSTGVSGRCWHLATSSGNRSEGLVPVLPQEFCATECVNELVAIMPRVDSINYIEESMKASRFAHLCSAPVR